MIFVLFISFHECSSLNMRFTKEKQMKPNRPDKQQPTAAASASSVPVVTSQSGIQWPQSRKMEMALFCVKWKQVLIFCHETHKHTHARARAFTSRRFEMRVDQTRVRGSWRKREREQDQLQCSLININRLEKKLDTLYIPWLGIYLKSGRCPSHSFQI